VATPIISLEMYEYVKEYFYSNSDDKSLQPLSCSDKHNYRLVLIIISKIHPIQIKKVLLNISDLTGIMNIWQETC